MATFNYTVDTHPMADQMNSVSHHVTGTTGAVVAMQTAVIIAEDKAADHVCNNVNRGFYSLIRSQISQKMAKLQSEVDSLTMQLLQQKNALLSIKNRMERDYNMISKRYIKLFDGLNSNLKNRVFELDKPTVDFACKEVDKFYNRGKYLTATAPVTQLESISASQKIIASNVKLRGLNVINSMRGFLFEMNHQKKLTDQILINESSNVSVSRSYIPVIICECNRDKSDSRSIDIIVTEAELVNVAKSAIRNSVYAGIAGLHWSAKEAPSAEVRSEFSKFITASDKTQRIKDLAIRLYQSSSFQTLK
ncbi:MAG TPA: hypothetical protein PLW31_13485 [Bacteroidales bacterium]|jgi:hypothetical protein|nr:hypothetical protein [Bacteroidales bacterium]HOX79039.1 hypothetical protein [Bacteroidales bacterium]